jgi:hypothetical protein
MRKKGRNCRAETPLSIVSSTHNPARGLGLRLLPELDKPDATIHAQGSDKLDISSNLVSMVRERTQT